MGFNSLLEKAQEYLPEEQASLVKRAYDFAAGAHEGQKRKSGKPFIEHPLATALTLTQFQLDATALAAALLHDVPEDCGLPLSQIEAEFGPEVSKLVNGTTKLTKLTWRMAQKITDPEAEMEDLRRMFLAIAEDLRVVFIKFADRLDNMRTLDALSGEKRRSVARETLEIYAPLAHRLGIWEIKWQLEDLAFRYLEPREYYSIARLLAARRDDREKFINQVIETLGRELSAGDIKADIAGRPKHIYSIYEKMKKYSAQGKDFLDIHDLLAIRILVEEVSDCYKALGVIHGLWHPRPEEFNDFIANPKDNGYQSLHTTVICQGKPLEIQIRTYKMHHIAEYGVAAHWRYKEADQSDINFQQRIAWLRQLIEWQQQLDNKQFLEAIKTEILIDQVYVYTPKGDIKALPKGATPIDFAYHIHTDLGHRCQGARVNGRLVPLSYTLSNGDTVEIIAAKDKGPSLDWLNLDLGYARTSHSMDKIRQWFRKQERGENINRGRDLLVKEFRRLGISLDNPQEIAKLCGYATSDDLFASLGYGGITPRQVALKVAGEQPTEKAAVQASPRAVSPTVAVPGISNVLTKLGRCCHPLPSDDIVGYVTRYQGITVHQRSCRNVAGSQVSKERLVGVKWGDGAQTYPASVQVDALDRVGLIRDITMVIAEDKVNIAEFSTSNHSDKNISLRLTLEVRNLEQLSRILFKTQNIRGVHSAVRLSGERQVVAGGR